jgi:type IV pilus assembly protein PilA
MASQSPQAGWYPDPTMPNTQRYWDGHAWTQHAAPLTPTQPAQAPKRMSAGALVALIIGVAFATIIVVAILAGIAIPVFFSQRKKEVDKSVVYDVTSASLSMESYYSTNNSYPATKAEETSPTNLDRIEVSAGNSITIATDGTTGYCIAGTNPDSNYSVSPKVYDSDHGGLQADGASCSKTYVNVYTLP